MSGADYFLRGIQLWNQRDIEQKRLLQSDRQHKDNMAMRQSELSLSERMHDQNIAQNYHRINGGFDIQQQQINNQHTQAMDNLSFKKDARTLDNEEHADMMDWRYASLNQQNDHFSRQLKHQQSNSDVDSALAWAKFGLSADQNDRQQETHNVNMEVYSNQKEKENNARQAKVARVREQRERQEMAQNMMENTQYFLRAISDGNYHDLTDVLIPENVPPDVFNAVRDNSHRGSGIHFRKGEDGYIELYTKAQGKDGKVEYLPFTEDPKDNSSTPIRIPENQLVPVMHQFTNVIGKAAEDGVDNDGSLISQAISQYGGLAVHDGELITQKHADARIKAQEQADIYNKEQKVLAQEQAKEQANADVENDARWKGLWEGTKQLAEKYETVHPLNAQNLQERAEGLKMLIFGEEEVKRDPKTSPISAKETPENKEKSWRDYIKENTDLVGAKAAFVSSHFGNPQKAINATKAKRQEIVDLMIAGDSQRTPDELSNFIETGVMASQATLKQLGIDNKKQLLEMEKLRLEVAQKQYDLSNPEGSSYGDFLTDSKPVFRTVASTMVQGDEKSRSGQIDKLTSEMQTMVASWAHTTGTNPSVFLEYRGQLAVQSAYKLTRRLNEIGLYDGQKIDTLGVAFSLVGSGIDLNDEEGIETAINDMALYAKEQGVSLEQASDYVLKQIASGFE